ncbi:heat shock factor 2-binding protein isoform X1 [Zootoca vivipara]|uniref:heat shock factor 2-binding protein isoform X1 n=1 Tax=Zootoca vivipara TaxID=8524 RepID=UPI0015928BF1|nr:heat shock factor 2-binding protein isoform X1 [Zootoca vivipara]
MTLGYLPTLQFYDSFNSLCAHHEESQFYPLLHVPANVTIAIPPRLLSGLSSPFYRTELAAAKGGAKGFFKFNLYGFSRELPTLSTVWGLRHRDAKGVERTPSTTWARGGFRIRNGSSEKVETQGEFVKVRKRALERLTTEVMQLHDILPKILNYDILENLQKLDAVETIVERKDIEVEQLRMDCEHYKARLEAAQADCMKERKEKLTVRQQLNEAKQQLLQQAEYCTEMGSAVCTLLWSISSNEEAVKSILGSEHLPAPPRRSFCLYPKVYLSPPPHRSFSLYPRDVAALACGREFLVNSNQVLLDTMMQLLGDMKQGCCTKLKVLMLMSLYNVSISVKGLKYISESPGFFPLLWWLLSDPDPEVCLHVLRLLQSVILEPDVLTKSAPEIRDSLPLPRIHMLSKSRNADLQILARELLEDLKILENEI